MKSTSNAISLEENLLLSNEELTSNWAKLSSLIRAYENIHWDSAQKKARELLKEKTAIHYIEQIRNEIANVGYEYTSNNNQVVKKGISIGNSLITPNSKIIYQTIEEENFRLICELIYDICFQFEQAKNNQSPLFGTGSVTGFPDIHIEYLHFKKGEFYFRLFSQKQLSNNVVFDPEMKLKIDFNTSAIFPLSYQDRNVQKDVYKHLKDNVFVDLKERKFQDQYLNRWLKQLIDYGYEIEWDDNKTELPQVKIEPLSEEKANENEFLYEITFFTENPKENRVNDKSLIKDNVMKDYDKEQQAKAKKEKLIHLIFENENISSQFEAEEKAESLIKKGEVYNYILTLYKEKKTVQFNKILENNFKLFLVLIPDLSNCHSWQKDTCIIKSANNKFLDTYRLDIDIESSEIIILSLSNIERKDNTTNIYPLLMNISDETVIVANNYDVINKYKNHNTISKKLYSENENFMEFLLSLLSQKYIMVQEVSEEKSISTETKKEIVINRHIENAKKIPVFEVGQVQLTQYHKNVGITEKMIQWINRNHSGMLLKPKEIINFDQLFEFDDVSQMPRNLGCRISRTGQVFYSGMR